MPPDLRHALAADLTAAEAYAVAGGAPRRHGAGMGLMLAATSPSRGMTRFGVVAVRHHKPNA
jgi:hypothetical protein